MGYPALKYNLGSNHLYHVNRAKIWDVHRVYKKLNPLVNSSDNAHC
jgi:hypothetical protein